jgi:lysophospholipase L1-like esterase
MGLQQGYVSAPGDFTAAAFEPARTISARPFISGVDVEVNKGGTIVALGDSITDGAGSTAGANRRWPDRLAERLAESRPQESWGVVNAGMSGNRVLMEGIGPSALARFDRDVLAQSGVSYVIVFEGINDLGLGYGRPARGAGPGGAGAPAAPKPTADALIHGYRQLIARAHARGVKVIGATIAPYEGANYWSEDGEAQRQAINKWMLTSGEFDGVVDFDAALRDPASPLKIADGKHAGDHLHGNDAGYEAAANAIDLRLFK